MVCCDIHNPELASLYTSAVVKIPRQPCCSRLQTVKDMSNEDKEQQEKKDGALRLDLEVWRRDQAKKEYGQGHLHNLGPSLVMGMAVRERIIDCACHAKIKTADQLERETKWARAIEFSLEIIQIIEKHYPIHPLPTIMILEDITALTYQNTQPASQRAVFGSSALYPTKRQVTCSACRKPGHIRMHSGPLS